MDERLVRRLLADDRYTRREVLRVAGLMGFSAATAGLLAACGATSTPAPTSVPTGTPGATSSTGATPSATAAATQAELSLGAATAAIGGGLDVGPYYVALSKGWWRDLGLNVTATDPPGAPEAINQLVAGQATIGSIGSSNTLSAGQAGIPIKIIEQDHGWSTSDTYSEVNIVALKASGIQAGDIAGLKGKKVGYRAGTDNQAGLSAFLSSVGLSLSDIQSVEVRPVQAAVALANKTVDAVCCIEPFASVCLVTVPDTIQINTEYPPTYMPGACVMSSDFLDQHRDVAIAFVAGHARGMQVARQDPGTMIAINAAYVANIPIGAAFNALKTLRFDPRMSKLVTRRMGEATIPGFVKAGLLPAETDPVALAAKVLDGSVSAEVQKAHPEYYSDLPAIAASDQY